MYKRYNTYKLMKRNKLNFKYYYDKIIIKGKNFTASCDIGTQLNINKRNLGKIIDYHSIFNRKRIDLKDVSYPITISFLYSDKKIRYFGKIKRRKK
jgi:hypothetical protein